MEWQWVKKISMWYDSIAITYLKIKGKNIEGEKRPEHLRSKHQEAGQAYNWMGHVDSS